MGGKSGSEDLGLERSGKWMDGLRVSVSPDILIYPLFLRDRFARTINASLRDQEETCLRA